MRDGRRTKSDVDGRRVAGRGRKRRRHVHYVNSRGCTTPATAEAAQRRQQQTLHNAGNSRRCTTPATADAARRRQQQQGDVRHGWCVRERSAPSLPHKKLVLGKLARLIDCGLQRRIASINGLKHWDALLLLLGEEQGRRVDRSVRLQQRLQRPTI